MQRGFVPVLWVVVCSLLVVLSGGSYYFSKHSAPAAKLQVTNSPTVTPQSTLANEVAGWKIYTNKEAGFTFKYPSQYREISYPDGSMSIDNDGLKNFAGVSVRVFPNKDRLRPDEYIDQVDTKDCSTDLKNKLVVTDILVNGHPAAKYIGSCEWAMGHDVGSQVFVGSDKHEIIQLVALFPEAADEKLLSQIISTFKFTSN